MKKKVDLFGDEAAAAAKPQNEFEALLNGAAVSVRRLSPGDRFRGEVLAVSGQEAFISTGTPTDAVMPFSTETKTPPKTGDVLDVVVVRAREGEILVKAAGSRDADVEAESLEDAFDMELPVQGTVLEAVKGGFRVKVQAWRAFCPISQMDFRVADPAAYVGKSYAFIITKYERGRDLVVSRRKLLEQERAEKEGEFLQTVEEGAILEATVFRLEKYGAFVRTDDGVEGLIPIREMAWGRIGHPQEVVNLDQRVQVKMLHAVEDGDRLKVSFSLKQGGGTDDPWQTIENDFPVGRVLDGTVDGRESFGLFVRLAPGVTGLLPRSAWRDSTDAQQYEGRRKGDTVKVRVDRIDTGARKLSFSLPRGDEDESWRGEMAKQGSAAKSFGTFGDLMKGLKVGK